MLSNFPTTHYTALFKSEKSDEYNICSAVYVGFSDIVLNDNGPLKLSKMNMNRLECYVITSESKIRAVSSH